MIAAVEGRIWVFRVSRIVDATLLDERRVRPADFDLKHYWDQWQADFRASLPRYDVMLRVPIHLVESLAHAPFGLEVVSQSEGIILVRLHFEQEEPAADYIFRSSEIRLARLPWQLLRPVRACGVGHQTREDCPP